MRVEDVAVAGMLAFVALIIGVAGYQSLRETQVERACLAHGYPHGDWRWIGPAYCIKRVDQTDTVVPLESLR